LLHSFGKITSGATFERTLPDRGHAPASIGQDSDGALIICDIAADLLAPEVLPCRRPFEQMAVVPMPEAAIHEYDGPVTGKNQIGFPGQILYMQPIAQPGSMQRFTDQQFRFCMAAFDGSHIPAAGRGIVNVGHTSGGFALPRRLDQRLNMRLHDAGNLFEYGHRYRIAELLVSLSI
jgi:hypothetical protein